MIKREQISPVIFLVVIMAVILGTGTFAALYYVTTRPERPRGTEEVVINGEPFIVQMPPERRVRLVGEPPPPVAVDPQPTPDPNQQAPEGGQGDQAPAPTAVPADTPVPPTAAPSPDQIIFVDYAVQQTDTLFSIANSRADTSIPLMARFGIDAADVIPGNVLRLPVANPNFCPQAELQPYLVHEGDTAFSLGRRFNTTAENLQAINNLDPNFTLRLAEVICVPVQ